MTKSKKEGSRKGGRKGEAVKCPHLHFKEDVIDRNVISRQQYLDLLCTPKGYRWQVGDGEPKPFEEVMARGPRKIVCSGRRLRKPERTYVHNFLAEVWALLTPEMVDRLKGMLMNEFGMTPEQAMQFIMEQRAKTVLEEDANVEQMYKWPQPEEQPTSTEKPRRAKGLVLRRGRKCLGIRHYYREQFNQIISAKLADYLMASLALRRTANQRKISEWLLKQFCDVTSERFTLQNPKSLVQKLTVVLMDKVSNWLVDRAEDADALVRRDREIDDVKAKMKAQENGQ